MFHADNKQKKIVFSSLKYYLLLFTLTLTFISISIFARFCCCSSCCCCCFILLKLSHFNKKQINATYQINFLSCDWVFGSSFFSISLSLTVCVCECVFTKCIPNFHQSIECVCASTFNDRQYAILFQIPIFATNEMLLVTDKTQSKRFVSVFLEDTYIVTTYWCCFCHHVVRISFFFPSIFPFFTFLYFLSRSFVKDYNIYGCFLFFLLSFHSLFNIRAVCYSEWATASTIVDFHFEILFDMN